MFKHKMASPGPYVNSPLPLPLTVTIKATQRERASLPINILLCSMSCLSVKVMIGMNCDQVRSRARTNTRTHTPLHSPSVTPLSCARSQQKHSTVECLIPLLSVTIYSNILWHYSSSS